MIPPHLKQCVQSSSVPPHLENINQVQTVQEKMLKTWKISIWKETAWTIPTLDKKLVMEKNEFHSLMNGMGEEKNDLPKYSVLYCYQNKKEALI